MNCCEAEAHKCTRFPKLSLMGEREKEKNFANCGEEEIRGWREEPEALENECRTQPKPTYCFKTDTKTATVTS